MCRSLVLLLAVLIFCSQTLYCADQEIVLPGSITTISKAFQESSDVIVGTLTARGGIDDGPPGIFVYFHGRAQVGIVLYGDAKGEIVCNFSRRVSPAKLAEQEPTTGIRYIIFLNHAHKDEYTITKFVVYSDDQLSAIQKMIKDK